MSVAEIPIAFILLEELICRGEDQGLEDGLKWALEVFFHRIYFLRLFEVPVFGLQQGPANSNLIITK